MTMSFPSTVRGWWQPGARFLVRVGRRTLVDSLYLLTAPVTAAAGLLLVLGGLFAATAGLRLPRRSPGEAVARRGALGGGAPCCSIHSRGGGDVVVRRPRCRHGRPALPVRGG